jgi:hypothetical protein
MPLNKFVPLSPDPYITSDPEMTLAKFGHLNTIVDYLNTYVVVDSLQLAGSGPITSTARYISDSTGVNSAISISTIGVGIGTDAPIAPLNIYNSSSSVSSVILVEQDTSAIIGQINQYRKNGSVNLTSGTELGRLSFGGYFNSTYSPFSQVCSAVIGYYGGTGTDRTGGLRLTTWNGGGATTRLQVAPDGKVSIGTTGSNAKLQIVGDGSTSATTSLLVQNSGGTVTPLKTTDDGTAYIGWDSSGDFNSSFSSNGTINIGRYGNALAYYGNTTRLAGQTWKFTTSNVYWGSSPNESSINTDGTVSLGSYTAVPSAMLSMTSTTKGFLKPRVTTAQKNAIVTPAAGLEVYDTDLNRPCFYNGTSWVTL